MKQAFAFLVLFLLVGCFLVGRAADDIDQILVPSKSGDNSSAPSTSGVVHPIDGTLPTGVAAYAPYPGHPIASLPPEIVADLKLISDGYFRGDFGPLADLSLPEIMNGMGGRSYVIGLASQTPPGFTREAFGSGAPMMAFSSDARDFIFVHISYGFTNGTSKRYLSTTYLFMKNRGPCRWFVWDCTALGRNRLDGKAFRSAYLQDLPPELAFPSTVFLSHG